MICDHEAAHTKLHQLIRDLKDDRTLNFGKMSWALGYCLELSAEKLQQVRMMKEPRSDL